MKGFIITTLWAQLEDMQSSIITSEIEPMRSLLHLINWWFILRSPKDSLDIILSSEYNHSDDLFNPVHDVVKQPETNDKITFRRLRNTKDVYIKPPVHLSHPLKIGGVTERLSIHGVKLINSGVHSQITNHGFTRQQGDGNFFNY